MIPNEKLTLEVIPQSDARRSEIESFALAFDGYAAAGSFEACAETAHSLRDKTLTELRITLFFRQRARRFVDLDDAALQTELDEDREHIRQIRMRVEEGQLD